MNFSNQIPSLNQFYSAIEEYKNIDWIKLNTYEEIKNAIPSVLQMIPVAVIYFEEKIQKEFYRLTYPFGESESFDSNQILPVSRFSYPPPQLCNKFGRVNFPNKPVLYTSINSLKGTIDEFNFNKKPILS